jgi:hypothetical protein
MAWTSNGANAELDAGINHVTNPGHENVNSLTLGGLQAASDAWNSDVRSVATTPHSVLAPYAFSRNASPNGTSGDNWVQGFGTVGNSNGQSADSFDKNMSLRMARNSSAEL